MALLVTIGNICVLGNFQLGIWGISGYLFDAKIECRQMIMWYIYLGRI